MSIIIHAPAGPLKDRIGGRSSRTYEDVGWKGGSTTPHPHRLSPRYSRAPGVCGGPVGRFSSRLTIQSATDSRASSNATPPSTKANLTTSARPSPSKSASRRDCAEVGGGERSQAENAVHTESLRSDHLRQEHITTTVVCSGGE